MAGKKLFGKGGCYIAAEVSANHGQDLSRALDMIWAAKACGADAVKFQTYTPDTLTIDSENRYFKIKHPKWGGQTLYKLYGKAYTPWSWFMALKKAADKAGISFFSTAYDKSSVDFLEKLGVPFHKIASFELVDIPLIEYAAKTKKPIVLSTGMADLKEIKEAVNAARKSGAKEVVLLKCVSSYPADPAEMNLRTIGDMAKRFGVPVGISDHTLDTAASVAAVALGAVMVEKHFTLSRKFVTPDSFFSIEPDELKRLVSDVRTVEKALGSVRYGMTEKEKPSRVFRRSLFVVKDIKSGERFSEDNVRSIRPSDGLAPKFLGKVLRGKAKKALKRGIPLTWGMVKSNE